MRASSQGSFTTLLLLVPVLAVPLFAIFGLPEISTDTQQTSLEEEFPELSDVTPLASDAKAFDAGASPSDTSSALPASTTPLTEHPEGVAGNSEPPLWSNNHGSNNQNPPDQKAPGTTPADAGAMAWADTTSPPVGTVPRTLPKASASPLSNSDLHGMVHGEFAEHEIETSPAKGVIPAGNTEIAVAPKSAEKMGGKKSSREKPADTPPLTWQDAVQRLHALQIRNFRLEPGAEPSVFVFICSYTPADNPRISYRFEAEANEPLKAVEKVLQQIEEWSSSR
jgi:hypothetical protein